MRLLGERVALFRVQTGEAVCIISISQTSSWWKKEGSATNLNIPICLTMWSHFPGVFNSLVRMSYNWSRKEMILCAIVLMSRFHSSNNSGLFKISAIYPRG